VKTICLNYIILQNKILLRICQFNFIFFVESRGLCRKSFGMHKSLRWKDWNKDFDSHELYQYWSLLLVQLSEQYLVRGLGTTWESTLLLIYGSFLRHSTHVDAIMSAKMISIPHQDSDIYWVLGFENSCIPRQEIPKHRISNQISIAPLIFSIPSNNFKKSINLELKIRL